MTRSIVAGFQTKANFEVETKSKRVPLLPRKPKSPLPDIQTFVKDTAEKFPVITEVLGR